MWLDIASIVFACVTANHLGLVSAAEGVVGSKLPIVNCPKCCSFWCVLTYQLVTDCNPLTSLAISFLASYVAIWLELCEGFIDSLYLTLYEKIYSENINDTSAADADNSKPTSTMS